MGILPEEITRFNIEQLDGNFYLLAELSDASLNKIPHLKRIGDIDRLAAEAFQIHRRLAVNKPQAFNIGKRTDKLAGESIGEPRIILRRRKILERKNDKRFPRIGGACLLPDLW